MLFKESCGYSSGLTDGDNGFSGAREGLTTCPVETTGVADAMRFNAEIGERKSHNVTNIKITPAPPKIKQPRRFFIIKEKAKYSHRKIRRAATFGCSLA